MSAQPNSSVDQIFDALGVMARSGRAIGVVELARDLDLPTSTAHRLLVTLQDAGLAERDSTGAKYELGFGANSLVHALFQQYPLARAALDHLYRLAEQLGETTAIDVRVGWLSVRMAGAEGWREIHAGTRLGDTRPLADSASGLAVLAFLSDESVEGYIDWESGGKRAAARTRGLRRALEEIRQSGYAHHLGSNGGGAQLGYPVRANGQAVAAISIHGNGPAASPSASDLKRVRTIADDLERLLERDPSQARDPFAHLDPDELTALVRAGR
jgi:DNA-binding IclR family transcriptional regulator